MGDVDRRVARKGEGAGVIVRYEKKKKCGCRCFCEGSRCRAQGEVLSKGHVPISLRDIS